MPLISFDVKCTPPKANHQRKKIVRVGGFSKLADTDQLNDARSLLTALFAAHRPHEPVDGPIQVWLSFMFPPRKSDTSTKAKRERIERGAVPMDVRPDLDNLAKTTLDVLASLRFFHDDAQIVDLRLCKFFGNSPGISVIIDPFDQEAFQFAPTK